MQDVRDVPPERAPNAIRASMRRRTGRLGILVTLLAGTVLALVLFAVYAYQHSS